MATNYLQIISEFFPSATVSLSVQDPTSYANIIWGSTPIAQATLDTYASRFSQDIVAQHGSKVGEGGVTTPVINNTLSAIAAGIPVYSTGTCPVTGRAYIAPADGSIASKMPVLGITVAAVSANSVGLVCLHGILYDAVNTNSWTAGDSLYVATGGGITNVQPNQSQWQKIATVREVATLGDVVVNIQSMGTRFTQRSIDIPIYGVSAQYYRSATAAAYSTVSRFIFRGSTIHGTPTNAKAIAWISSSSQTGRVRLYDITNSLTIATSGTFNNTTGAIIDLGTISNVPTGDAIFEVQILSSITSNTVFISAAHIYFT
jgi:hypothetical protein